MLSGVSRTRFLELEVRLRKKQRRQVLRIPKGAHTKHLHVTTSAAHWVLTAKAAQLELMTWGRARLGFGLPASAAAFSDADRLGSRSQLGWLPPPALVLATIHHHQDSYAGFSDDLRS